MWNNVRIAAVLKRVQVEELQKVLNHTHGLWNKTFSLSFHISYTSKEKNDKKRRRIHSLKGARF